MNFPSPRMIATRFRMVAGASVGRGEIQRLTASSVNSSTRFWAYHIFENERRRFASALPFPPSERFSAMYSLMIGPSGQGNSRSLYFFASILRNLLNGQCARPHALNVDPQVRRSRRDVSVSHHLCDEVQGNVFLKQAMCECMPE